jgi:GNAT superfamily N-acetyltransferase
MSAFHLPFFGRSRLMSELRNALIKLGYANPELRVHLRPVLDHLVLTASADVSFRVKAQMGQIVIQMYMGTKKIGWLNLHETLSARDCQSDIDALEAQGYKSYKIWQVVQSRIEEEFRGQGLGKELYRKALEEVGRRHGRSFVVPYACTMGSGSTSKDALRVWTSLAREYPSSGLVFYVE